MELKVLKKTEDELQLEVIGEGHTFMNALRSELWNDKDVAVAAYRVEHPVISNPVLFLKTKKKDPYDVLVSTSERLSEKFDSLKKLMEKSLK